MRSMARIWPEQLAVKRNDNYSADGLTRIDSPKLLTQDSLVIYTNLLIFISAIFLFTMGSIPDEPPGSFMETLLVTGGILLFYRYACGRIYKRVRAQSSMDYFGAEKRLSILALLLYGMLIFLTDIKYYLHTFSIDGNLPVLTDISGLILFLVFLSLMWSSARKPYSAIFGRSQTRREFILSNIKSNLPIVLPWIMLSLVYDLVLLAPIEGLSGLLESRFGDLLFFGLFLFLVVLFFPPLVKKLWGCKPLPPGPLKDHLVEFCKKQNFTANLYLWPLFEGRILTAGVMGLVPGLRYILLTPAIIETMSMRELESIMTHEIGHVKKKHMLLYVLLIGGFGLFIGTLAEPLLFTMLSMDWVFKLSVSNAVNSDFFGALIGGFPLLILLLLYYRFVFGYFIRNFERQADLHVVKIVGTGQWLISAFEKISSVGGHKKEKKNWHHFGIGERIDCLAEAERDRGLIKRHDRKVMVSLLAFLILLGGAGYYLSAVETEDLVSDYEERFIEFALTNRVKDIEDEGLWYHMVGDLMYSRKQERKAIIAYNRALEKKPLEIELLNNLAWLLLTAEDSSLRDPERALVLAQRAAQGKPSPHILDTLATALWANGRVDEAIATEWRALQKAPPTEANFYRSQIKRFSSEVYSPQSKF